MSTTHSAIIRYTKVIVTNINAKTVLITRVNSSKINL